MVCLSVTALCTWAGLDSCATLMAWNSASSRPKCASISVWQKPLVGCCRRTGTGQGWPAGAGCRTAGHPQTAYFDSCPRTAPAGNSALWTLT
jgi:hypothetical protein